MRLAVVLLWYVWLEVLCTGPLDLPQLMSERKATYRVWQIAWFPWRAKDVGETDPRTPMGIGGPSPFRLGEGGG